MPWRPWAACVLVFSFLSEISAINFSFLVSGSCKMATDKASGYDKRVGEQEIRRHSVVESINLNKNFDTK